MDLHQIQAAGHFRVGLFQMTQHPADVHIWDCTICKRHRVEQANWSSRAGIFRDFAAGLGPSGGKMRNGWELVWTFLISWKCISHITKQIGNIFLLALETKESKWTVVYSREVLQIERNQFMLMSKDEKSAPCCRRIFHFPLFQTTDIRETFWIVDVFLFLQEFSCL